MVVTECLFWKDKVFISDRLSWLSRFNFYLSVTLDSTLFKIFFDQHISPPLLQQNYHLIIKPFFSYIYCLIVIKNDMFSEIRTLVHFGDIALFLLIKNEKKHYFQSKNFPEFCKNELCIILLSVRKEYTPTTKRWCTYAPIYHGSKSML